MSQARSPWLLTLLLSAFFVPAASAQDSSPSLLSRLAHRVRHAVGRDHDQVQPATVAAQPAYEYAYVPTQPVESASAWSGGYGSDPYGFANVLNRIRSAAGLRPLAYDSSLSSSARRNNVMQSIRGLGHFVNAGTAQNSAYNYDDAESVAAGWMNSPGHRANMLSPTASSFGIAFGPGPYWTMNTR